MTQKGSRFVLQTHRAQGKGRMKEKYSFMMGGQSWNNLA